MKNKLMSIGTMIIGVLLAITGAVVCVMSILFPTVLIGSCMKPDMACNVLTFPITHTLSAIGIVLQGILFFVSKEKER